LNDQIQKVTRLINNDKTEDEKLEHIKLVEAYQAKIDELKKLHSIQ